MEKPIEFKHAYDPLGEGKEVVSAVKCPKCGAQDFDAFSNQYGVMRTCRRCKNQWTGGGVGAFPEGAIPPPVNIPVEEDIPIMQFTGGPHRRFGGDE